ncbi:MAG: DUF2911 domain-containing protein [Flavitalea sp.]
MRQLLFLSMIIASTAFMECSSQAVKSPRVTSEGKEVKVAYGQPSKNGRVIFGGLEQYGKVWRTGANEATEITFAKDASFGGKPIKAGTYSLFTIPTATDWTIILNPELKQWGAYGYDKIKDKDALQVTAPSKKLDAPIEKLTLRFTDANSLIIEWDQTQVEVPVKVG